MVRVSSKRTMLTGGFFFLLRAVFLFCLPGCPCLHFISFPPSPFGPMGSLWGGAVVVRGYPGDIPGFAIEIWILGYNGCCVLVAGKLCPQQRLSCVCLSCVFLFLVCVSFLCVSLSCLCVVFYSNKRMHL